MKYVVIGGVAAGMSAASKIIRNQKDAEVLVYEKGNFLSYGACGLPYYVGGFNDDYKNMIARTKEQFENQGIAIKMHHEVLKVIPHDKKIMVRNHDTSDVFIDSYDKLIISTGANAIKPPIEGVDKKGIYFLKTLDDGLVLKEIAKDSDIKNVVIIGGGYIGIEVVEAFLHLGKNVRCIEAADRILMPFDPEVTEIAQKEIENKGVHLHLNEKVAGFEGDETVSAVRTDKGNYPADLVIMSIGVRPATGFLKGSGINLAKNGAILVDREQKTNIEDIYSAGDCAEVYSKILEENTFLPLGTVANKCGRIAGDNMMGTHKKFLGALGSAGIKICDLEAGRTGMSERDAARLGIKYKTTVVSANDHPAYYPDPTPIMIKVIYEEGTKRILGAQAIGVKGAVMRINMFAIAIQCDMTTDELGMTDLIYAPPFAGVWDAVHIACNACK